MITAKGSQIALGLNSSLIGATLSTSPAGSIQLNHSLGVWYTLISQESLIEPIVLTNELPGASKASNSTSVVEPASNNETGTNFTDLESAMGPVRDPFITVVLMTIVYAFILITGVTGNVCTCIVIWRRNYLHTATNFYLFSLAISDLLLLILGLPQDLVLLWRKYPYMFGESFCILRGLTSELSTNASILTITSFTIERYVAICHPLRSHTTLKLSRVVKTIVVIWIIGALCAAPIAYQFGIVYVMDEKHRPYPGSDQCSVKSLLYTYIFEIATMVFFVVPICIITVLYILIGIRLRASSKGQPRQRHIKFGGRSSRGDTPSKPTGEGRHHLSMSIRRQNASRRAVIKMLVAVVIAFFFCYSPFHAQRVMASVLGRNDVNDKRFIQIFTILTHISGVTYYLSSTINPILYQVMSKKFQLALRETLPCCKKHDDDLDLAISTVITSNAASKSVVVVGHQHNNNHHPQQYPLSGTSKQSSFKYNSPIKITPVR